MCGNDIARAKMFCHHSGAEGEQKVRGCNQTLYFIGMTPKRVPCDDCLAAGRYQKGPGSINQWRKTQGAITLSVVQIFPCSLGVTFMQQKDAQGPH
jgi:hypothetical protein